MIKKIAIRFFLSAFAVSGHASEEHIKQLAMSHISTINGWCTDEKACEFIDLVLEVKPKICVEIGVFAGASIVPVATALKFLGEGVVYAVDPWNMIECLKSFDPVSQQDHIKWWSKHDFEMTYLNYQAMLKRFNLEAHVCTMRTTSVKAAHLLDDIDILYLDGNRSEVLVNRDIQLYFPKVRSGGYIWLNACLWKEFQKAVEFLTDNCNLVRVIDGGNSMLFQKPHVIY